MKRLLYLAPSIIVFSLAWPGVGFWGPVIMLGGLIFLHELGHFLVAKWMKLPVEVFSLGFGPRLVGFKWRETDVRLSALPLGGYVKLMGYNDEDPNADDPNGFLSQPTWKRMLFYSGGIIFNLATAVVLLFALNLDQARVAQFQSRWTVIQVVPQSRAESGGLKVGDEILAIGEKPLKDADWERDIIPYIQARPEVHTPFQILRGGAAQTLDLVPANEGGRGKVGFLPEVDRTPIAWRPLSVRDAGPAFLLASKGTAIATWRITGDYVRLLTFRANIKELGGPIAIARIGSQAAKSGWRNFLSLCALLSINLAVLNALPIPFLDGGHVAMLGFERIRGKDLSISVKERILTGGFLLLASLMVLVFALDIWRLKH
ncbi:MAG: site-2 protease family protein [Holophagaceae bacterium]|nr:site-2 protease family protein [Holophagaceae bacterium]